VRLIKELKTRLKLDLAHPERDIINTTIPFPQTHRTKMRETDRHHSSTSDASFAPKPHACMPTTVCERDQWPGTTNTSFPSKHTKPRHSSTSDASSTTKASRLHAHNRLWAYSAAQPYRVPPQTHRTKKRERSFEIFDQSLAEVQANERRLELMCSVRRENNNAAKSNLDLKFSFWAQKSAPKYTKKRKKSGEKVLRQNFSL
jgi:hypothetical protein